jgi:hypothetical protein
MLKCFAKGIVIVFGTILALILYECRAEKTAIKIIDFVGRV